MPSSPSKRSRGHPNDFVEYALVTNQTDLSEGPRDVFNWKAGLDQLEYMELIIKALRPEQHL